MVIFHSYVSLPEGSHGFKGTIRSGTQGITIYQLNQEKTFWQTVIYFLPQKNALFNVSFPEWFSQNQSEGVSSCSGSIPRACRHLSACFIGLMVNMLMYVLYIYVYILYIYVYTYSVCIYVHIHTYTCIVI